MCYSPICVGWTKLAKAEMPELQHVALGITDFVEVDRLSRRAYSTLGLPTVMEFEAATSLTIPRRPSPVSPLPAMDVIALHLL